MDNRHGRGRRASGCATPSRSGEPCDAGLEFADGERACRTHIGNRSELDLAADAEVEEAARDGRAVTRVDAVAYARDSCVARGAGGGEAH